MEGIFQWKRDKESEPVGSLILLDELFQTEITSPINVVYL
jgi:hypothetical protein